jgi:hypothetical protein
MPAAAGEVAMAEGKSFALMAQYNLVFEKKAKKIKKKALYPFPKGKAGLSIARCRWDRQRSPSGPPRCETDEMKIKTFCRGYGS